MIDREKKLAAGVAIVVALWGGDLAWNKYQTALKKNLATQQITAQNLSTAQTATARGQRAEQKLVHWQSESLPTNTDIAQSLYQDWLQQQLIASGLKVKENNIRPRTGSKYFREVSFIVTASGSLDQLTDFLYRFYQAPHLHRISAANLLPSDDRSTLKITFTIDALSLEKANRSDQLAEGSSDAVKQTLQQLKKTIGGRNLFATHQPKPVRKPTVSVVAESHPVEDSEAKQAVFSSINYGRDGWLMSIRMKDSGKVHSFREGDEIEIGRFAGRVEQLDGERRRAVIVTETQRVQIWFGQTLDEAQPMEDLAS